MKITNKDFFFCYNKKLSDFLTENGIKYITIAIEPKSKRQFSLYFINEQLQQLIKEYKQQK